MRIFVSFSSRDRETARGVEAAIKARRPEVTCFLDEHALTGGVYWIPRLGEEIGKADVVLLLVGQSIGRWQELEYYAALELSRRADREGRPCIIPVAITDRPFPGLPFLSTLQQISALDPTSTEGLGAIERA